MFADRVVIQSGEGHNTQQADDDCSRKPKNPGIGGYWGKAEGESSDYANPLDDHNGDTFQAAAPPGLDLARRRERLTEISSRFVVLGSQLGGTAVVDRGSRFPSTSAIEIFAKHRFRNISCVRVRPPSLLAARSRVPVLPLPKRPACRVAECPERGWFAPHPAARHRYRLRPWSHLR